LKKKRKKEGRFDGGEQELCGGAEEVDESAIAWYHLCTWARFHDFLSGSKPEISNDTIVL
jgi:hypothetical protein